MNCLQLTDYLPEYPGNFGNTLIAVVKDQRSNNRKCIISFPEYRQWHIKIEEAGAMLIYIPVFKFKEKKLDRRSVFYLNKLIKNENINLIHVHFGLYQKFLSIILKFFNPKIKIVWHWRGDIPDNSSLFKRIPIFLFYRIASELLVKIHIANSKHIYNRIIEKHLVNKRKLFSISNAIDVNLFDRKLYEKSIETLGSKYEIQDYFILIMVRNFRRSVDFEIILDTMEFLRKESPEIQLLWIGYGETESEYKNLARLKDLTNIKFLGKINNPIPYYFISKINIVAWEPWCNETINNTVYEALSCGLPVVGLDMGSLSLEFNENDGVFTVPLDPSAYARKILYIKDNYGTIQQSIKNGKDKVLKHFSLDSYVRRLNELYEY